jgi:hypothetical protein
MFRLSILINQDEFILHGEDMTSPLRGCVRQPTENLASGHCLEKLDLVLQGSQNELRSFILRLQTIVERLRLGHEIWLALQPDATGEVYQSRLYAGKFGWLLNSVRLKGIGIRLELERQNFWQLPWRKLALTNVHGSLVQDGLQIDNRADSLSGKQNWCWLAGSSLLGDLAAPVRVHLRHDIGPAEDIDRVMMGLSSGHNQPLDVLEGELADSPVTYGSIIDTSCHGNAFGLVQWDGTIVQRVLSWILPGSTFQGLAGKQIRPLVRLVNLAGLKDGTWLSWKLYHGGLVYQSAAQQLSRDRSLQVLPSIHLPTLPNQHSNWADLRLELHAHNRETGTNQLAIDAIFLFFRESWRQFSAMSHGKLAFGEELIDQCDQSVPYIHIAYTDSDLHAYQTLGNGLWLIPGEDHVLQVLWDTGLEMPLEMSCHLEVEYQPRVRMLT